MSSKAIALFLFRNEIYSLLSLLGLCDGGKVTQQQTTHDPHQQNMIKY